MPLLCGAPPKAVCAEGFSYHAGIVTKKSAERKRYRPIPDSAYFKNHRPEHGGFQILKRGIPRSAVDPRSGPGSSVRVLRKSEVAREPNKGFRRNRSEVSRLFGPVDAIGE